MKNIRHTIVIVFVLLLSLVNLWISTPISWATSQFQTGCTPGTIPCPTPTPHSTHPRPTQIKPTTVPQPVISTATKMVSTSTPILIYTATSIPPTFSPFPTFTPTLTPQSTTSVSNTPTPLNLSTPTVIQTATQEEKSPLYIDIATSTTIAIPTTTPSKTPHLTTNNIAKKTTSPSVMPETPQHLTRKSDRFFKNAWVLAITTITGILIGIILFITIKENKK